MKKKQSTPPQPTNPKVKKPTGKSPAAPEARQPPQAAASNIQTTHEEDLDAVGSAIAEVAQDDWDTPLPGGDLTQAQLTEIFGEEVDVEPGNYLFRILQSRRTSGSLVDIGLAFGAPFKVKPELAYKALEYLRNTHPVDEEAAAEEYTRRVEKQVLSELGDRARNLGILKADEDEGEALQGTEHGRSRYGTSVLQEMRDNNKRVREAMKREKEKKEKERREQIDNVTQKFGPLQALRSAELNLTWKEASVRTY